MDLFCSAVMSGDLTLQDDETLKQTVFAAIVCLSLEHDLLLWCRLCYFVPLCVCECVREVVIVKNWSSSSIRRLMSSNIPVCYVRLKNTVG